MMMLPVAAMLADTLLVRPVDVPVPWYSVASGVLSIVVTLLLLGIAVALLGMARALKGAEKNLGGRMQGLADELIPLARNLNQIATQLSAVTADARGDLKKLSGTIGAVDGAVRDALADGEARLHQFGAMLDAVQDEAQATVASATGIMRGVRTGAGSLVSSLFDRAAGESRTRTRRPRRAERDPQPLDDADVFARLAALEAAFALADEDDDAEDDVVAPHRTAYGTNNATKRADADDDADWDEDEGFDDDGDDDEDLDDAKAANADSDEFDDDDDDEFVDDEFDDDEVDDDDDDEEADEEDDVEAEDDTDDAVPASPATGAADRSPRDGGPRIRPRGRA